ncbi:putative disease resistance protein At4g11170 [Citrus sinensis]|uniref:putative disease resistance protein At4g11170 n=1 Tax=Citrus sinensis TaxID=2711 RepID=UPI0022783A4F|nr:putative disease resistance protein At4g11170 [Citrus sinensis]XP_052294951.1 putative disease resistance protein At4g11170 [Citrus sinensis]
MMFFKVSEERTTVTTLPAIFIQPCLRKALKLSLMTSLTEEMKFHSRLWMQLKHQLFHSSFSLKRMPLPDGVSMNLSKSSHVRWRTGSFGDSFLKLEEMFKENSEKLQTWRNALKEAAGLSGFHSQNIRSESELVKEVVNQILKRLAEVSPCSNKNQLVGVESRVEEIESLLGAESKDVYALGIWGIGGIDRTTIARAIFNKISSNFEGSCFLQNVREESQRPGGLGFLQQKLLSKLLQDGIVIPDIALSFRQLSRRKVLIVLDDVTCFRQIKSLIGSLD